MAERIQKVLARAGIGSRREIEQWIREGRVCINRRVALLGDTLAGGEKVTLDSRPINAELNASLPRVLMYNKPEGRICSRKDPEHRPNVYQALPKIAGARWIAVGRLDINSTGLMLFTTDGELANRLMHPSSQIERVYAVRVLGEVTPQMIKALLAGVQLEDGPARFDHIRDAGGEGANHWYHVTLREGRQREVRRLWEQQGVKVSRLIRIQYGNISLPRGLRPDKWQELDSGALRELYASVNLSLPVPARADGGRRKPSKPLPAGQRQKPWPRPRSRTRPAAKP